jgi:O-antigen biosynthesis protein
LPLSERRRALRAILPKSSPTVSEPLAVEGRGRELFELMCAHDLEGVSRNRGQFIAGNRAVLPIVVRAGALAPAIPARDLCLSPRHALFLDGVLVPVELLVNSQTILQAEAVDRVDYFHLEFEAHELILAEGAPAESYVECDNRQGFHNAQEFAALLQVQSTRDGLSDAVLLNFRTTLRMSAHHPTEPALTGIANGRCGGITRPCCRLE